MSWTRCWAVLGSVMIAAGGGARAAAAEGAAALALPEASADRLPRWRGFNLQEKFMLPRGRQPFREDDFRLISELGFNFVRLPMDYRLWIRDGDWEQFDEEVLEEIDEAVAWGEQYGIHVMLNFHRAPGWTVARPPEALDLWTDPEAQRVCALHWRTFARRYRGVPNRQLSFNLFNEPPSIDPGVYLAVCRVMVEAIREEDPNRLVIADGISYGVEPVPALRELGIAQATRGYRPMDVSHYQANWVDGAKFHEPRWPRAVAYGVLLAPGKSNSVGPILIDGEFEAGSTLRLRIMTVSNEGDLVVSADADPIWVKRFECGPGEGEWSRVVYREEWDVYQNVYDRDYRVTIPRDARRLQIALPRGDWLEVGEIGLTSPTPGATEDTLPLTLEWGRKPNPIRYTPDAETGPFAGAEWQDRQWLRQHLLQPWMDLRNAGTGVMVGEFGAYNKTPHDVALRWMEDQLANWQEAEFGWALWNFRGSFGILNSNREDVAYEDWNGQQLDRKMLELLLRY